MKSRDSRCTKAHDVVVLTLAQQRNLLSETLLHTRTADVHALLAVHFQDAVLLARMLRADVGRDHAVIWAAPLRWAGR